MKQDSGVCSWETGVCSFTITGLHGWGTTRIPSKMELHPNHPRTRALSLTSSHGSCSLTPLSDLQRPQSPPTYLVYGEQPQGKEYMVGQFVDCTQAPGFPAAGTWLCSSCLSSDPYQSLLPLSEPSLPRFLQGISQHFCDRPRPLPLKVSVCLNLGYNSLS